MSFMPAISDPERELYIFFGILGVRVIDIIYIFEHALDLGSQIHTHRYFPDPKIHEPEYDSRNSIHSSPDPTAR